MPNAAEYLSGSRLFRRLRSGTHGHLVELYAARLVEVGLSRHGTWRSLNVVGNLLASTSLPGFVNQNFAFSANRTPRGAPGVMFVLLLALM